MSSAAQKLTVDSTLGAVFVGFAVACCIYGILLTQICSYFWNYPSDRPIIKLLVVVILVLETADQVFIAHLNYYYSITNFADVSVLAAGRVVWSFVLQLMMGAFVGAIVKASFGIRVWRFSERSIWITGLIMLLALGQLCLAMIFTIKAFQLPSVYAVVELKVLGTCSLAAGTLTDVVTAGALCYFLNRLRTGYKQSDSLVSSLVRYAVNTGALTSTVSIAVLVLYNTMPHNNLYFVALYFTLSKLYAISYLATLNTRRMVKGRGTDRQGETSNNTNMFHLGTRVPSMLAPVDYQPPVPRLAKFISPPEWDTLKVPPHPGGYYGDNDFPLNSFHPGNRDAKIGQAF